MPVAVVTAQTPGQPLPTGIALAALECIGQAYDTGTMAHDTAHKALDDYFAAAREPQPAPGPGVCECGHSVAHHAFGDDVCAVLDCPCTRPRPAPASASQARRHEAQAAPGDLRAALESLAAFWVREYVTGDGWPEVCAQQLLDVLGGAREPKPAPELAAAMAESRELRGYLDDFTHAAIDLGDDRFAKTARAVRRKAGLPPVEPPLPPLVRVNHRTEGNPS